MSIDRGRAIVWGPFLKSNRTIVSGAFCLGELLLAPSVERGQDRVTQYIDPATGETYHIEGGLMIWNPAPDLTIASESLGIPGTEINAAQDLGVQQKRLLQLRLVV